jgi:acetylglutamate kinase
MKNDSLEDESITKKAEVLIEALPHIQQFNRKIIVVKYGGSIMVDEKLKSSVISDVILLKLVGSKPIIVHGGGKEINKWSEKIGLVPKFVDGLRITDAATMELVEMVLNRINKSIVQRIERLAVHAVGVSGKDGNLITVRKKKKNGDMGFVGEVTKVQPKILMDLIEKDFLPVVCPIGVDCDYQTFNINADEVACAIAKEVNANELVFLTDKEGVYRNADDEDSIIAKLTLSNAKELLKSGCVGGGMLPKIENCIDAVDHGVNRVHILDGRIPHSLMLEIFTNEGVGTSILADDIV